MKGRGNMNEKLCCYDFLISKCNSEAAGLCFSTANGTNSDGRVLFVHGASGSGKTHLLNTTLRLFRETFPWEKVTAVTLNELVADYIKDINCQSKPRFIRKCAENKLLLIDDVGFLVGKTATQEDLSVVFSDMALSGSTVILFSEYGPERFTAFEKMFDSAYCLIAGLEKADDRLKERFLEKALADAGISATEEDRKEILKKEGKELSLLNAYVLKLRLRVAVAGSVQDGKAVNLSRVFYDEV